MKEHDSRSVERIVIDGVKPGVEVTLALFTPIVKNLGETAGHILKRQAHRLIRRF